ncbi:MAG: oligosaccharide flippase family protein [Bacteroidetes bacterium]|nr:oligosaccharide flippase family protein [Bacteroidota bacterium]
MQKKFVANLAFLLFMNLFIKSIYILGFETQVQNEVGAASYGIYFAIFNFSFLLTIVLDFGITNFNNKNIAQNNHLLTKHFSGLFTLKILLAVIYIIVVVVAGLLIGYDTRLMKLLLVQGFNMFLLFFINYLRSNLAGLHLFKTDAIVSILDRSILIVLCIVMLKTDMLKEPDGIMYFVYAQTIGYSISVITAFLIILNKTHTFKLKWNWAFSLMILKKSLPFAILTLLMSFYNRIDTVMIERMLPKGVGDVQSGIYAQAFRLLDATNMIAFLTAGMLLPIFSRMLKHKESVESLVKLISTLLLTPAIVIGVGCVFYSKELMGLLYQVHVEESAKIFSLLMLSFIAVSTTYIFGTLLTANGNMKQLNTMAAFGMILNITLNLLLIRQFEAYGSAISSMITQFLTAIIQVMIAQRIFKFKINYRLINTLIMFAIGVVAINYGSRMLDLNWMMSFVLMVVTSVLWAFVSGIISIKGIFRILKYG